MASKEYEEKWRSTLDEYEVLVKQNQPIRSKVTNYKPGKIPNPITEDEMKSLEAESKAWADFLELARNPY